MKKLILICLSLLLILAAVPGCAEKPSVSVKIGLAAPKATHGWVSGVAYSALKYCVEENLEHRFTQSGDKAEMEENLEDLAAWGADVIVLWPQWAGMEDAVNSLIARGIRVVAFDVDIPSDGIYHITGDNYDIGYQSAKTIAGRVNSGDPIVLADRPASASVSELRKAGFYAYLEEIGFDSSNVFEYAVEEFTREEGQKLMEQAMAEHETIRAVYSLDDELSIGILQAVKDAGRTDVGTITGCGGMQEYFRLIADEANAPFGLCTTLYSPAMVADAIRLGIELCSGKESEFFVNIPTTVVTPENVSGYIDPENTKY